MVKLLLKAATREQSTIAFPYVDLETATQVANAILKAGAVPVTREQLAGLLYTTTNSGSFLNKLSATRMFGLIAIGSGKCELTDLGFAILDSADERRQKKARAEAFLNVPLFKRAYEEFKGKQLPPRPLGLETAFVKFGVGNNQKSTARSTFDKSANQAGFFPNGPDRLIEPIVANASGALPIAHPEEFIPLPKQKDRTAQAAEATVSLLSNPAGQSPFVQGLVEALPAPGADWTMAARVKWLQAAANNFDLMYKGDDGTITIVAVKERPL